MKSTSTRSEWEERSLVAKEEHKEDDITNVTSEMSRMSFEWAKHSVDQYISLDRNIIG